ncbi:phage integrase SAM-like domain-containing protein, partial [Daejeonella sp.]|uniref:phage integrase SAM-like domain-containing protein n=1 Tax=Daejeonella sp. TaxID=2805397 RepID=UPI002730E13F
MVQLKIILDTRRKKSDGTFPIMFRVTNFKQVNYLSFGLSITEGDWDESNRCISSNHPNFQSLNLSLSKKLYEIQKAVLALEEKGDFNMNLLKEALLPQQKKVVTNKEVSFLQFSKKVIEDLILEQRIGNAIVYQTAVNRIMGFCNNSSIKFSEIN